MLLGPYTCSLSLYTYRDLITRILGGLWRARPNQLVTKLHRNLLREAQSRYHDTIPYTYAILKYHNLIVLTRLASMRATKPTHTRTPIREPVRSATSNWDPMWASRVDTSTKWMRVILPPWTDVSSSKIYFILLFYTREVFTTDIRH